MTGLQAYTDADFRRSMLRALRLVGVLTIFAAALAWWRLGWASALLLVIGAAISASGVWEWLRLMTVVMSRMDATTPTGEIDPEAPVKPQPMGGVLVTFFLRLGLIAIVLYGSLKYLQGSAMALVLGLLLGIFALTIEGVRLVKAWTL